MMDDVVQVNFRMPAPLKARLGEAAERNNRSLTAEIVDRLEASFAAGDKGDASTDETLVREAIASAFEEVFERMMKNEDLLDSLRAGARRRKGKP